jgi:hypothetical protein
MNNKNDQYRILAEEYMASKIQKQQLSSESKKTLNEGRTVKGGGLVYGGFPRVIKEEAKGGLPSEMLADLFVKNSTEGYEPEDAKMYTPLPAEIHKQILPHVEDEVLMIGQGGRIPEGANLQKHINDLTKAIGILDKTGHGNHPAAGFLDRIRDTINDEHMSRRR